MYLSFILFYIIIILSKITKVEPLHGYYRIRHAIASKKVLPKMIYEPKTTIDAMPLWDKLGTCLAQDLADETDINTDDLICEEKNMTTPQLIQFHGYQCEAYSIVTKDGYILGLFKATSFHTKKKSVVLLHHGIMGSSDDWLLLGPGKALPYLLIDAGYDVWLINARGNRYSNRHISFRQFSTEFWDFSFHEMGQYDLPATIEFIRKSTNPDVDIHFVGHSMGGTVLLVLLSTLPEFNKVLKTATLIAPLAFMYKVKGPLKLLADVYKYHGRKGLDFLGEYRFMSHDSVLHKYMEKYIKKSSPCLNPLFFLANGGKGNLDSAILENALGHVPSGMSLKTLEHYIQLMNSEQFQKYNYGEAANVEKHGKIAVPDYNLSLITLPLILFSSNGDWLCTKTGMSTLRIDLASVIDDYTINRIGFKHLDFVWGENAPALVFFRLLDVLEIDKGGLKFLPPKHQD